MVPAGNGNNGQGNPYGGRGSNQKGRGGRRNGNATSRIGNVQPYKKVTRQDDRAQCDAFLGKIETETSNAMITCTILICG